MRHIGTGAGDREGLTGEHHTRDVPYDFFGKIFLRVLQTRQTVGRYGVRKPLAGLDYGLDLSAILCQGTL